jgi:hypothetical protein
MAGREVFLLNGNKVSRRTERAHRLRLMAPIMDYYGLSLRDLGGSSYLVGNGNGQESNVYQLEGVWAEAERLAGSKCDPLDPELLSHLTLISDGHASV